MLTHGILHSVLFYILWEVVDAVNHCPKLAFKYPTVHAKQKEIAEGFKQKSDVGFDVCAGCIDGMIVWTECPFRSQCDLINCGPRNFFCSRKHKYGLNLQGVCDHKRQFIEAWITHPAATSDFLSFTISKFIRKLETPGFLAPGLVLFGNNAYVSNDYMVTPYKGVSRKVKDDYNFFHSQVRINIECTFGIFVNRWAILRKALPARMSIKQWTALLTMALC